MWIKKPTSVLEKSLHDKLNFLFKSNDIYVMDNHLAAGWVWASQLDVTKRYNLFHIDRHFDLLEFPDLMSSEITEKGIELYSLSLSEYENLKQPLYGGGDAALFRWDNYIGNINTLYPDFFNKCYFATHEDGNELENFIDQKVTFFELVENIDYWIQNNAVNDWIVNIDIDYFFVSDSNGHYQIFTDDFIVALCKAIQKADDRIALITICLSPECCGGWEQSIRVAKLVCKTLGIDFKLKNVSFKN
ncbi:MAG: hypothetical protein POELPBGB_02261 [Bacteroidia bacterium]|nr:hypothetical protein [Bacteroidia bacterium]